MASKDIIINFKLNGVDKSLKDITTLNGSVASLDEAFVDTSKSAEQVGEVTTESFENADSSAVDLSSSIGKVDEEIQDVSKNSTSFAGDVNAGFKQADTTVKNLGDQINNTNNYVVTASDKGANFGKNLEKSAKGAAGAIGGLADGLELVGGDNAALQGLEKGLRSVSELLKVQELLSEKAFGSKSVADQTKALGSLSQVQKSSVVLTTEQAVASDAAAVGATAQAAGTTGAAVATTGLGAAMKALPIGPILLAIGALVALYEIFKEKTIDVTAEIQKQIDVLQDLNDITNSLSLAANDKVLAQYESQTIALEKQLELLKLNNGSIQAQAALEAQINTLKQKGLDISILTNQEQTIQAKKQVEFLEKLKEENVASFKNLDSDEKREANHKQRAEIDKQIKATQVEILTLENEGTRLEGQKAASSQFDLSIQKEKTAELQKQAALQLKGLLDADKEIQKGLQDRVAKIKIDIDDEKARTDLEILQNDIQRFFDSGFNNQVDFFDIEKTKKELGIEEAAFIDAFQLTERKKIEILDKLGQLELQQYNNIQREKVKANGENLKKIVDDIAKTEDTFKGSNTDLAKLIAEDNKTAAAAIKAYSDENNKTFEGDLNQKKQSILEFNKNVISNGILTQDELTGVIKQTAGSLEDVFSGLDSTINQPLQNVLDYTNKQIEVNGELIKSDKLVGEEKRKAEGRQREFVNESKLLTTLIQNDNEVTTQQYLDGIEQQIESNNELLQNAKLTSTERYNLEQDQLILIDKSINTQNAVREKATASVVKYQTAIKENITFFQNEKADNNFYDSLSKDIDKNLTDINKKFKDNNDEIEVIQAQLSNAVKNQNEVPFEFIATLQAKLASKTRQTAKDLIITLEAFRIEIKKNLEQDFNLGKIDGAQLVQGLQKIDNAVDKAITSIQSKIISSQDELKQYIAGVFKEIDKYARQIYAIASQLNDIQNSKDQQKINQIEKTAAIQEEADQAAYDKQQEIYETELEDLADQQAAKEDIVAESNNRINELENQLQNARGNRHKYILGLIETENKKRAAAQAELDKLNAKAKKKEEEKAAEEKARQEQAALNEKLKQEKIDAIKKQAFEREKRLRIANVIMAGGQAVGNAFADFPYPVAIGIAIAEGIVTAAQVVAISNEEYYEDGGMLYSINNPKKKRGEGGKVEGPSHANGGVKGTGSFANVEVEGDEYIVNKRSSKLNLDIIETINSNPTTKFTIVPAIAEYNKKMEDGGKLPTPNFTAIQSALPAANTNGTNTQQPLDLSPIVDAISKITIVTDIVQVETELQTLVKIRQLASTK